LGYPGAKNWPLPAASDQVLETVKQACLACNNRGDDIFSTCLRQHGASAREVASAIHFLMPNISDTEPVSIQQLLEAIEGHQGIAKAA
jgi:hypothetical protein